MGFALSTYSDVIGLVGVVLYVGAYAAMQLGFIRGQTYTYSGLNLLAASCVMLSLIESFNLSSVLVQGSWIAISIAGMIRLFYLAHRVRFSPEEKALLQTRFPALPNDLARRFFDAGYWIEGEAGTRLTEEGKQVPELIYLQTGGAKVWLGDQVVGQIGADTFIGEITCFTREPATTTVILDQPSRYFCIGVKELNALVTRNLLLRQTLETSFATETGRKLKASNEMQRDMAQKLSANDGATTRQSEAAD